MKKIILPLTLIMLIALSSCQRRCHCTGYDGSHTYYSEEQLKALDKNCVQMEYDMNGLLYSICEYDFTNY
jgi:hypothetical protein